MLKVDNIHTYYGKSYILHGLSFEIGEGEVIAILGRNGVGKTTTLRSIMGLTPPRTGNIFFKDKNIVRLPAYAIARLGIGYVPQGRHIFPELTVSENLNVGYMVNKQGKDELTKIFELFPILKERSEQIARTLSGGEQQMLVIARALNTNPLLLLMDEPTEGLMPTLVSKMVDVVRSINKLGVSILLVEQKVKFALETANRIFIMEKGTVRHEGTPEEIVENEEILLRYLGVKQVRPVKI